ncbi:MAG: bifunctional serine/threonine-protein kinase/formylglycine-generating enzyme family protein, partial [Prosthecobacter sp.]|nr:bifunctional serine/threonine-protein kinase/formylglycine-generating enzyme family protein [Prosthecobacter sp.]
VSHACPKCGRALPADAAAEGLCPRCLMGEAMQPTGPKKTWEPPTAAELAEMLPQYEVEKLLGRGGMGAVYQGTQKSLDRPVAIKILSATLDESDQGFAERFKNEARAMARLKHPGIVDVYQFGEMANGLLYIVMEFIDGTDVAKMIAKKGRLHTDHAMAITAHVCDALAYAHERGIIHRDIKPANIMVGYDGVVKVADFGLAKMTHGPESGLTQSGMAMGTLHYMAPEALMLGTAVDHRADIYAVGVMLYQMLTGKLPQGMFNMPSLMVKGLDPRYDSIIGRALIEDRDARYQSVNEMRLGLDEILTQPVAKVDAAADKAPAALDTLARPQRLEAAENPPKVEHAAGRTASWQWAILIAILVLGSWEYLRKRPAAALTPPNALAAADVAGVTPKLDTKTATLTDPTVASKDAPFVNSLGMKFVPVPGTNVLFCIHETRYRDYAAYADVEKAVNPAWKNQRVKDFKPVGRLDDHPVANVSWEDAQGFCAWLSKKDGKNYRLPTDREWSIAVGIGQVEIWDQDTTPATVFKDPNQFPWGSEWPPPPGSGNYSDVSRKAHVPHDDASYLAGYDDGFPTTAPVMSFKPNPFGLYDMGGNLWEWCEDWHDAKQKDRRVLRGASWYYSDSGILLSSHRTHSLPGNRNINYGFRLVLVGAAAAPAV